MRIMHTLARPAIRKKSEGGDGSFLLFSATSSNAWVKNLPQNADIIITSTIFITLYLFKGD